MAVEINLLKTKHGVLARFEEGETVEAEGALHKKRTFSILLIVVLLGVFAGLQYGERFFIPIQEPLMKSLDYALELIPKVMEGFEEDEATVDGADSEEDYIEIVNEGMKLNANLEEEAPPPVVSQQNQVVEAPAEEIMEPLKKEAEVAPLPVVPVSVVKQESQPKQEVVALMPQEKKVPAAKPSSTKLINAGSFLLKGNIAKLEKAGKEQGFSVDVKTVYRMISNSSFLIGSFKDAAKIADVEKNLNQRAIPFTKTDGNDGNTVFRTTYTPLSYVAEKQKKKLIQAGYNISIEKERRKTPLNQILIKPFANEKVTEILSYLKKNGFPAQVVAE